MSLNSHQLTQSLLDELEKESYFYNHSLDIEFYSYEKAKKTIERFFKYHKLNKK